MGRGPPRFRASEPNGKWKFWKRNFAKTQLTSLEKEFLFMSPSDREAIILDILKSVLENAKIRAYRPVRLEGFTVEMPKPLNLPNFFLTTTAL